MLTTNRRMRRKTLIAAKQILLREQRFDRVGPDQWNVCARVFVVWFGLPRTIILQHCIRNNKV